MNVALLGFGKAGRSLFQELEVNQYIEKISVFDPMLLNLKETIEYPDSRIQFFPKEFVFKDSYDLIVIATPDHLHQEYLLECIHREIPSFVEKPLVSSKQQLERILQALSKRDKYQMTTNLILRSSPLFIKLKREFDLGRFGEKVFIEGKYLYGRWPKIVDGWRGNESYSVILGGLIHLIDLACFVTGNFDHDVLTISNRLTSKEPLFVKDFAQVSLTSRATGFYSLSTNFSTNVEHRRDFSIYGDCAWVEVKGGEVEFDEELRGVLGGLSPFPANKGALLSDFIASINGVTSESFAFPNIVEIIKVLNLCLDTSTASL